MAVPTQRLLLWVPASVDATAVPSSAPAVLSLVPLSLLPLLSLSRLLVALLGGFGRLELL